MDNINSIKSLFFYQEQNQKDIFAKGDYKGITDLQELKTLPVDDHKLCSYNILHLMSEIGEVLEADKRWKSHRNTKYNKEEKIKEIADCFICLMNVAMFSGINGTELECAIADKIVEVHERI